MVGVDRKGAACYGIEVVISSHHYPTSCNSFGLDFTLFDQAQSESGLRVGEWFTHYITKPDILLFF
jgi:hypothetical protein